MEMIEAKNIDHINLIVSSLDQTKDYYERVFGFNIVPRENNPQTLVVESKHVHFFITQIENVPEAVMQNQHISFEVEDLDSVIEALAGIGITDCKIGEIGFFQYQNYRFCEWRDPDGIRIECVEVKR